VTCRARQHVSRKSWLNCSFPKKAAFGLLFFA
jgi:hypothetical protein